MSGRWETTDISTHTLRKEGDIFAEHTWDYAVRISTHTLRKEGDVFERSHLGARRYFNPHPPQGG